jgi:O-antigen/teichoic acid export membrane protein
MSPKKLYHRLTIVFSGVSFRLLASFSSLIISLCLVRTQSAALWGGVVHYLVVIDLFFSVINWGHAQYLIREFSLRPGQLILGFRQSLISRSYLMIGFGMVALFMPFMQEYRFVLILYMVARFFYQAFDPVVQYYRGFFFAVITELIGLAVVLLPVVFGAVEASVYHVITLLTVSFIVRGSLTLIRYRSLFVKVSRAMPEPWFFFKSAFPFFLLTMSAMLQQRTDLFVVTFFLDKKDTAQYQIFSSLLLVGQLGASLLISPFAKNVFRLPESSLRKLETSFMRYGLVLSLVFIALIYGVVRYIYNFNLSVYMYGMGYLYSMLFYVYLIRNYKLGKAQRQFIVAGYSFAGFVVSLTLSFLFTPLWQKEGALLAGLVTQCFVAVLYFTKPFLGNDAAR